MKNLILARLREPSTAAGIAGFIGAMSFLPHAHEVGQTTAVIGTAVASLLAIWLPEAKAPSAPPKLK